MSLNARTNNKIGSLGPPLQTTYLIKWIFFCNKAYKEMFTIQPMHMCTTYLMQCSPSCRKHLLFKHTLIKLHLATVLLQWNMPQAMQAKIAFFIEKISLLKRHKYCCNNGNLSGA